MVVSGCIGRSLKGTSFLDEQRQALGLHDQAPLAAIVFFATS